MAVTQKQINKIIGQVVDVREEVEGLCSAKEEVLMNAQDAEHPNEDRIEKLQTQFDTLEEVYTLLDEAISHLAGYEA
jgi:hypothetical protein